jgi:ribosomal protein L40E
MAKKTLKTEKEAPKAEENIIACGNCGAPHPYGTLVCDKCGYTRVYVQGR